MLDMFNSTNLENALQMLGELLGSRKQSHDIVVIGGGAMLLLDLIQRPTQDLDAVARFEDGTMCRAEPFPASLVQAVSEVGEALDLASDWLNPGPAGLIDLGLPEGFLERSTQRQFAALTLRLASEADLIFFKLYAAADHWPDRSKHLADLQGLSPTRDALLGAAKWCRQHDPSPGFKQQQLLPVLAIFAVAGDDV